MPLTDLQQQVRAVVGGLPAGYGVALAGGAALIVSGVVQRGTGDLDFFMPHPDSVTPVVETLTQELTAAGLVVTEIRAEETFARLQVESESDVTHIDVATDIRLMPAQHSDEGAILAESELAADKTLALTGRAEPRDYIDFWALAQRFSLNEICELAGAKDAGFTPTLLAEALDYIEEHPRALFDLDDDTYQQLVAFAKSTARELHGPDKNRDTQTPDDAIWTGSDPRGLIGPERYRDTGGMSII